MTSTIDIGSDDVADAVRWLDRARVEATALGSHVPAIRRAMDRYREATPDRSALRALQATRLDTLLRHAADTVPAYRHIHLGKDLSPFAKLAAFPVASKEDIRGDLVNRCSDRLSRDDCFTTVTSGTTGTPTRLVLDWRHLVHAYALTALRHQYYGVPSRPRVLQPRRSIPEWATHPSPALDGAQAAFFPITANAAAVGRAVALLEQFRPNLIQENPTNCVDLVTVLADARARSVRPNAVCLFGETVLPEARRMLSAFFDAPVYELYGMREFSTIAWECVAGRRHVEAERLWVEVVDEEGRPVPDGTVGELAITNLLSLSMPLIRYRTGDLAALDRDRCPCGQPHKTISGFRGRSPGVFGHPDGRRLVLSPVKYMLAGFPIAQFQIVRHAPTSVIIYVRADPPLPARVLADIGDRARRLLANAVTVTVESTAGDAFRRRGPLNKFVEFVDLTAEASTDAPVDRCGDVGRPPESPLIR